MDKIKNVLLAMVMFYFGSRFSQITTETPLMDFVVSLLSNVMIIFSFASILRMGIKEKLKFDLKEALIVFVATLLFTTYGFLPITSLVLKVLYIGFSLIVIIVLGTIFNTFKARS